MDFILNLLPSFSLSRVQIRLYYYSRAYILVEIKSQISLLLLFSKSPPLHDGLLQCGVNNAVNNFIDQDPVCVCVHVCVISKLLGNSQLPNF